MTTNLLFICVAFVQFEFYMLFLQADYCTDKSKYGNQEQVINA